jgi:hypothetical protein
MPQFQDSNKRKAVQRREVFTAWILLSAPIIGFVAYLIAYLGLHVGQSNLPLVAALTLAVACLFLLSWMFIFHTDADWRKTTRFIAFGLLFEGAVLLLTHASGRAGSIYFGVGSILVGLTLLFGAKKH